MTGRARLAVFTAVVGGLVGAALRTQLITHQQINGDEAVTGLMAIQVLHGHTYTFYWGNQYGGGELYAVVALFWLFGSTATALTATSSVLIAAAAVAVGVAAARLRPGQPLLAVAAGVAVWVWPEALVWSSTLQFGFRELTTLCGVLAVGFAARLLDRRSMVDAGALGLAFGVGWWSSPEIGYFAIAVAVALALTARRAGRRPPLRGMAVGVAMAVVGALPWIWTNARTGLASLHSSSSPSYAASTYWGRVHLCLTKSIPMMLGLRVPLTGEWLGGDAGRAAAIVLAAVVVACCLVGVARALRPGREVHTGCCVATLAFPLVYAAFPATSFWQDGHYAVFVVPLMVLSVVGVMPARGRPAGAAAEAGALAVHGRQARPTLLAPVATIAVLSCLVALTAVAFDDQFLDRHPTAFWRQPAHPERAALVTAGALERDGVRYGYADYWTAYVLDFVSRDRLQLTDPSADRWVAQYRRVRASANPAWIFYDPAQVAQATAEFEAPTTGPFAYSEALFVAHLRHLGVGYRILPAGVLDVVVTARRVDQAEVGMGPPFYGS